MDELEIIQYPQLQGINVFVNTVSYRSAHFHNEWEIMWVLDAPLKVHWQYRESLLQPGDVALFPPRVTHEFQQISGICTFLCLQFVPAGMNSAVNIITEDFLLQNHFSKEEFRKIRQDILDIAESYFSREPFYELHCYGKSALLLYKMLQRLPSRAITPEEAASESQRNIRLMRLTQFVEENYMHKIRLSDFAEAEGCSVSYLSHFIKSTMNQTFQDYVNSVRFSRACKLISEGNLSMLSVCMESGFSDYRYFSRTFQKAYGMTPAEYVRKANTVTTDKIAHAHSTHSQEKFLTRGQSLGILQHFRNQLADSL